MKNLKNLIDLDKYKYAKSILSIAGSLGEDENLEIEKSIYLGGKKILDNTCITISGNLVNKNKSFNWEIKKKLDNEFKN